MGFYILLRMKTAAIQMNFGFIASLVALGNEAISIWIMCCLMNGQPKTMREQDLNFLFI